MTETHFRNESLAERVARYLGQAIAGNRWDSMLPGVRSLASEFEVSIPTLRHALEILEQQGLVAPAEPGRGRMINRSAHRESPYPSSNGLEGKQVAYVLPSLPSHLPMFDREVFDQVARSVERLDGRVVPIVSKAYRLKNPALPLENLVAQYSASAWVVKSSSRAMAKWFIEHSHPCVFANGDTRGLGAPRASLSMHLRIRQALRHLVDLGHERVSAVLSPVWKTADEDSMDDAALGDEWRSVGLEPTSYHLQCLRSASAVAMIEVIDSLFKFTPPTAILLADSASAIACLTCLQSRGLRVPQDVSLICLDNDRHLDWTIPRMARIEENAKAVSKPIVSLLQRLGSGQQILSESYEAEGRLLTGESVSTPRRT